MSTTSVTEVPVESYLMHDVTPLDNLVSLSVRYGVSVAAIKRLNPFLILSHHIPPTAKSLKIPCKAAANSKNPPLVGTSASSSSAVQAAVVSPPLPDYMLQPGEEEAGAEGKQKEQGEVDYDDVVDDLKQAVANEMYFAVKGLSERFNLPEAEVLFVVRSHKGNVDAAREDLVQKKQSEKVYAFAEKVHGECTVEEAEHWLKSYHWDVSQAAYFYKRHLKKHPTHHAQDQSFKLRK
eukprot:TRINITY_DN603_c0_g2_i1.p2 TRINITY_DN603_c0_g2~~TRINITY_DN603_c0_g2_i1.p2  ORF type:complete len:236 (+),score=65.52 TRINITY_DN603_c0_g2_i1:1584-2291(+)